MGDQPAMSTVDTVNLLLRMVHFLTEQLEAQAERAEQLRQMVVLLADIELQHAHPLTRLDLLDLVKPLRVSLLKPREPSD